MRYQRTVIPVFFVKLPTRGTVKDNLMDIRMKNPLYANVIFFISGYISFFKYKYIILLKSFLYRIYIQYLKFNLKLEKKLEKRKKIK